MTKTLSQMQLEHKMKNLGLAVSTHRNCGCPINSEKYCEHCCDHDDVCTDERCCLVCGKDMTEELACEAEARCEGDR